MQKMGAVAKIISGILLLATLWTLIFLSRFLFATAANDNLNFVPEHTGSLVIIDGDQLLKQGFEDLVVNHQDNNLIRLIIRQLESESDAPKLNLGVEFKSDIIYFTHAHEDHLFTGILVNLNDPAAFELNVPALLVGHQTYAIRDDVGLILSEHINRGNKTFSDPQLQAFAESLLDGNHQTIEHASGALTTMNCTLPDGSTMRININLDGQSVNLSGELNATEPIELPKDQFLQPEGFHLTSFSVPKALLQPLIAKNLDSLPQLTGFSLNYLGTQLIEKERVEIVPNMGLLLHFKDSLPLTELLDIVGSAEKIGAVTKDHFTYGNQSYFYHYTDSNSLYIGQEAPNYAKPSEELIFRVNGPIDRLTLIEGKGMMVKLLALVPMYTAGKEFAAGVDEFSIELKKTSNKSAKLKGTLRFKEGHFPSTELLELILEGQFFN